VEPLGSDLRRELRRAEQREFAEQQRRIEADEELNEALSGNREETERLRAATAEAARRTGELRHELARHEATAAEAVRAYVEGFQHGSKGVDTGGVLTVVKHWVGYGAAKEGFDSHNRYGRFASYSGSTLDYHIKPFLGAIAANVGGVMPTYSILEGATWRGRPIEPVGAGYNRQLLTEMLRGQYGFRGMILTDWAITNDCGDRCRTGAPAGERPSFADVAMQWGVEDLPKRGRFVKAVKAGVDQFGGTEDAPVLVDAVKAGELTEARLDESVRRIMEEKFALGLFESPFVDADAAATRVGTDAFRAAGLDAQKRC
jgi:beta-glucosidase